MMDSKKTAKQLFEYGLSVEKYEDLQNERKERLNLWLDRRIQVLAEQEMELIAVGDKILTELRKLYL